jgi:hypothetical protein
VLTVVALGLLLAGIAKGQGQGKSPRQLIEFLTYQSQDRREGPVVFDCGLIRTDRAAAKALAESGRAAIPALEEALGSIERDGMGSADSQNAGWLLDAYARIEGAESYERLRRMDRDPGLAFIRLDLDNAIALSLGLTSYVSGSNPLSQTVDCSRPSEPRRTLNQFILAWVRGDREWLDASLGPNAKSALASLLEAGTWATMRAEYWSRGPRPDDAVGYRFEDAGRWSEPQETLADEKGYADQPEPKASPELDTRFTSGSGGDCGRYRVKFVTPPKAGPRTPLPYLIDNSDLGGALRVVASCAVQE